MYSVQEPWSIGSFAGTLWAVCLDLDKILMWTAPTMCS